MWGIERSGGRGEKVSPRSGSIETEGFQRADAMLATCLRRQERVIVSASEIVKRPSEGTYKTKRITKTRFVLVSYQNHLLYILQKMFRINRVL